METGGRLGTDARACLKLMADRTDDPVRELRWMQRAVSSALAAGVARMHTPTPLV